MIIEIGNDAAIEGYREVEDGPLKYRDLEGERITTLHLPDDWDILEVVQTVRSTLPYHMDVRRGNPRWVSCSDAAVAASLSQVFALNGKPIPTDRPKTWGEPKKPKRSGPKSARAKLDITVTNLGED
jgi:hypothetical protein